MRAPHPELEGLRLWYDPNAVYGGDRVAQASFVRRFPELLALWKRRYPRLDIRAEMLAAYTWMREKDKRRPAISQFIGNWLRKANARLDEPALETRWKSWPIPPRAVRIGPNEVRGRLEVGPLGGFIDWKERLWAFMSDGNSRLVGDLHQSHQDAASPEVDRMLKNVGRRP